MKSIILTALLVFSNLIYAEKMCPSKNLLAVPAEIKTLLQALGERGHVFTAKKGTSVDSFSQARSQVKVGDILETTAGQYLKLEYFIPINASIIVGPNSKIKILSVPTEKCGSSIEIISGTVVADADHQKLNQNNCPPDSVTENVEIKCLGTKYSVDLSAAIAEAGGDSVREEKYSVSKGAIQIKLKRAHINKINKKSQRILKIAKNGTALKLRAGQKAKIKINRKTKVADIDVIEP